MPRDADDKFYDRADQHIHLSNDQMTEETGRGKVSASMLFAASRFNAWVSACGFNSAAEMEAARQETLRYFTEQYQLMLEENFDDYVANFDNYMAVNRTS